MSLALFNALERQDLATIALLLSAGADANAKHPSQPAWTPLKAAAEEGAMGAVILLLRHGAYVDGERQPGDATPLIVATYNRQAEVARLLLAAGADPSARDDEGDTPLGLSIRHGDDATAELLRLCGADA